MTKLSEALGKLIAVTVYVAAAGASMIVYLGLVVGLCTQHLEPLMSDAGWKTIAFMLGMVGSCAIGTLGAVIFVNVLSARLSTELDL